MIHSQWAADATRVPVYIESQVTSRDLHARLLLGARLASFGHPVLVGRSHWVLAVAKVNAPGVYISDHGFLGSRRLQPLKESGNLIYKFCEESTAYAAPDLYKKARLIPEGLNSSREIFCTNGQQMELIDEVLGVGVGPPRYNTGNIRFELLGPKFRGVYSNVVSILNKRFGEFVLITTNGKLRNVRDVRKTVRELQGKWRLSAPDAERFGRLIEARADAQKKFIQDMVSLAAQQPKERFILRAKYNEIRIIRELFADRIPNNIRIVTSGSIQPWVLAARAVVMNNCTTGMDAYAAGTVSIFYHPEGDTVADLEGPAALSIPVFGKAHLAETLSRLPNNPVLTNGVIERYMPSLKQQSHEEIASRISNLSQEYVPSRALGRGGRKDYPNYLKIQLSERSLLWKNSILYRLSPSRALGGRVRRSDVLSFVQKVGEIDRTLADVRYKQKDFELYAFMYGLR